MEYLDVSQPTASRICNLEWDEWVSITVVSAIAKRIPDDVPLQRFFDYGKRTEQAAA
jgi:hypothetical protein